MLHSPYYKDRYLLKRQQRNSEINLSVWLVNDKVARFAVIYPASAKQDAVALRDTVRSAFPQERVDLQEDREAQQDGAANEAPPHR